MDFAKYLEEIKKPVVEKTSKGEIKFFVAPASEIERLTDAETGDKYELLALCVDGLDAEQARQLDAPFFIELIETVQRINGLADDLDNEQAAK